jgi:hypothetical protein
MSLAQTIQEIKSHEFAARLSVVSGYDSFFRAAGKEPVVASLLKEMRGSGEVREEVLGYVHDLSQLEVDKRYENPNDTALAILLWLTDSTAPDYSLLAADLVDRTPQCWYAKKLARRILTPPKVAAGHVQVDESPSGPRFQGGSSEEAYIVLNLAAKLQRPHYLRAVRISSSDSSTNTATLNVSPVQEGE